MYIHQQDLILQSVCSSILHLYQSQRAPSHIHNVFGLCKAVRIEQRTPICSADDDDMLTSIV